MKYIRIYEIGLSSSKILELFVGQYMMMFGSNPDLEELLESKIFFINFFGFTCIVNIVSLNLLIAVISNTFDSVYSSIDAFHLRTKAQILQELSLNRTWDREKSQRMYLHIIHNSNIKLKDIHSEGGSAEDEFSGRVRMITDKIQNLQDYMKEMRHLFVMQRASDSLS